MTCPPPPGVVPLFVEYGFSQPADWVLLVGGWLCLLVPCVFLVRSEARHLPPGSARRSVLWLMGTGGLLIVASYPLLYFIFTWQSAVYRWSASLSGECFQPARQVLQDESPQVAMVWVLLMLLFFGGAWALIELGHRRKRKMGQGPPS